MVNATNTAPVWPAPVAAAPALASANRKMNCWPALFLLSKYRLPSGPKAKSFGNVAPGPAGSVKAKAEATNTAPVCPAAGCRRAAGGPVETQDLAAVGHIEVLVRTDGNAKGLRDPAGRLGEEGASGAAHRPIETVEVTGQTPTYSRCTRPNRACIIVAP